MDGYYSPHQQQQQQHQQFQQQQQQPRMSQNQQNRMQHNVNDPVFFPGGDSLDDIVRDNQDKLYRRQSMPQAYSNSMSQFQMAQQHQQHHHQQQQQQQGQRRMSSVGNGDLMTFGTDNGELNSYQFNQPIRSGFPAINTSMGIDQIGNYMAADPNEYSTISPEMMSSMMPSTFASMSVGAQMAGNGSPMNLYSPSIGQFPQGQLTPQIQVGNDFPMDLSPDAGSMAMNQSNPPTTNSIPAPANTTMDTIEEPAENMMSNHQNFNNVNTGENNQNLPTLSRQVSTASGSVVSPPQQQSHGAMSSSTVTQPTSGSVATTPSTGDTPRDSKEKTIYSKSGFDMLKALWLVATRKNPKIQLGAVDMSCAFVVCDVSMNDCPIIYVSDNFQNLTGYSRHEIVGQNCRFLQAPDGKVEAGSKREFVDDGAVFNLKKMVHEGREVQQSLINYRKGGKPFLNLLTMIPIPWDTDEIRYFIGFQIDLVECPDAIASNQDLGGVKVNYKHSDIGQYIWTPPQSSQWEPENGQTLGVDDVSTLLQQFSPNGLTSDWHKQSWDKMLLENTDDVVHVLSLKGLFLYLSPSCKKVLEYEAADLVGNSLSTVCHPSDIVPVTRELKDTTTGNPVNIVFRIRRKNSGYTWFESHGSLFVEQGKGRKCIILVGRKRPVFALSRRNLEANGGIGDSELWTKLSTSGLFLYVSSNIRSLLDLQPDSLVGTSIQDLMRKESRPEFGRATEKARRGKIVTCKHEVQNRRGQVLQAQTTLYPGDASEGQKPSFLLAQTKLLKASSRNLAPASISGSRSIAATPRSHNGSENHATGHISQPAGGALAPGTQDAALASEDNIFDELRTTKCSSWQFELRQMEKVNRILAEELGGLLSSKKKRKRRKGVGNVVRDCANCHTRNTPEWRRGPSGQRDLCNSCGLRWAKQTGRVSPRNSSRGANTANGDSRSKKSNSPSSPLHKELSADSSKSQTPNGESGVNPAQLTKQKIENGTAAPSGAPSATGVKSSAGLPPLSHSSMLPMGQASSMASIQEERETSQP
ncbi:PAS domain-containing protein [Fusarium tricinctum]|uniref:PAS domain-containing protein n=2 Tax=Fusarium tricinctum species complex TaxID=679429 RepID=A0A8K0S0Y5_9HYPO|nr:PAS domain-containing protein [Fusarium tricinctum]